MTPLPWKRRLVLGLGGMAAAFALCAGAIVVDGLTDVDGRSDVAIVLGSRVFASGRPSPGLRARLDRALELYRTGEVGALIVSGGLGAEGFDEAHVMKRYLMDRGVPEQAILQDSAGVNTAATARNSAVLMREHGFRTATAVTQYYHIARTTLALRNAGIAVNATAHARIFELRDLYSIPREVVGYAAYLVR